MARAEEAPARWTRPVALAFLAGGALLGWREIVGRILQIRHYHWKFGTWEPVTAGREAFVLLTLLCLVGASIALAIARLEANRLCRVAGWAVAVVYLACFVVWAGLIASPLVYFAR